MRTALASTTCLVLVAVLATAAVSACGGDPGSGERLAAYAGVAAKVVDLEDGTRMAVGSPDGHRIQVQWSAPGADGWTPPQTVWSERSYWTHAIAVQARRSAVAIDPDYYEAQVLDDDYPPHHTSQILCRPGRCEPGHRGRTISGTLLDGTGAFASFTITGRRLLLWHEDSGFRMASWRGIEPEDWVSMLPDGSFVAVHARSAAGSCHYDLMATEVHGTRFERVAGSGPRPGQSSCFVSSMTVDEARVSAGLSDTGASADFARSGGSWWVADPPRS